MFFGRAQQPESDHPEIKSARFGPGSKQCALVSAISGCGYKSRGCILMLFKVRSGSFGAGLGHKGPQTGPKLTPKDPDRTSDNLKMQQQVL
jgi:hypothetical protein